MNNKKLERINKNKTRRKLLTFLGVGFGLIAAGTTATILSVFAPKNNKPAPVEEYTVSFNKGSGTSIVGDTSVKFKVGSTLNDIEIPNVEKQYQNGQNINYYPFVQWKDSSTGEPVFNDKPLTKNISLTASFADEEFSAKDSYSTITFQNGGDDSVWLTGITRIAIFKGRPLSTINKPKAHTSDPEKTYFKGWSLKDSAPRVPLAQDTKITTDLVLVPVFSKAVNVTFDPTDKGTIKSGQSSIKVVANTLWKEVNYPEVEPNDPNSVFEGWYKSTPPDEPSEEWITSNKINQDDDISSDLTAYARYVAVGSVGYVKATFIQPDHSEGSKQPVVTYSGPTTTSLRTGQTWGSTPKPLPLADGYSVLSWEVSTDYNPSEPESATWTAISDNDVIEFETPITVRPVMSPNVSAIQILGPDSIPAGSSEQYSSWVIPTAASTQSAYTLYKDAACAESLPETEAKCIFDSSQNIATVSVSSKPSVSEFYIQAVSTINPTIKNVKKIQIKSPILNSNNFLVYTDLSGGLDKKWYKLANVSEGEKIDIIPLDSETPAKSILRTEFNEEIWVGELVESIPHNFLKGCTKFNSKINFSTKTINIESGFLDGCTSFVGSIENSNDTTSLLDLTYIQNIGSEFLHNCTNFNSSLVISAYSIGQGFLENCENFNSVLNLGTKLTTIGERVGNNFVAYFLCNCSKFNQNIEFPSTLTKIGDIIMNGCDAFTSTISLKCKASIFQGNYLSFSSSKEEVPMVQTGFRVKATTVSEKSAFTSTFPSISQKGTGEYGSAYRTVWSVGKPIQFATQSWTELIRRITFLRQGDCTEEEFADSYILSNGKRGTQLSDLRGEKMKIKLTYAEDDVVEQEVRVIGTKEDKRSDNKTLQYLTFEFTGMLTSNKIPGKCYCSYFSTTGRGWYGNSSLRKLLVGQGSGTMQWRDSNNNIQTWLTKTLIDIIPSEVADAIIPTFKNTTYGNTSDKLFLLSELEMATPNVSLSDAYFYDISSLKDSKYVYYVNNGGIRVKYCYPTDTTAPWKAYYWTRHERNYYDSNNCDKAYNINTAGGRDCMSSGTTGRTMAYNLAFSPCFCL